LEEWKMVNVRFWVCSVCGNLVTDLNFPECPVCFNPLSKYNEIK
jgi:rubrerythrin